jgi:integrase
MKHTRLIKHVVEDTDRHGNVRIYFRRKGHPKVRLPGPVGSPEFEAAYAAALEGKVARVSVPGGASKRRRNGSLGWLLGQYYASPEFNKLTVRSQRVRRQTIEPWAIKGGDRPFADLTASDIRRWRDAKQETPGAANNLLKVLRVLFAWAVEHDLAKVNPVRDVKRLVYKVDGFHSWTVQEIHQFEARHPVGSKARLALALLLYTMQRRSDVVRLGPPSVIAGYFVLTQQKTAACLELPILPALRSVIDATPHGQLAFLITEYGKPFTSNGFGNWFRNRCDEAGLPNCSAHGLRKAAATLAAMNGATVPQLMALGGWKTEREAIRYIRAANQKALAGGSAHLIRLPESVPLSKATQVKVGRNRRKASQNHGLITSHGRPGRGQSPHSTASAGPARDRAARARVSKALAREGRAGRWMWEVETRP